MTTKRDLNALWRFSLSVALSVLLVITLVPLGSVRAALGDTPNEQTSLSEEDIVTLLAAEEYIEGEVIVVVDETIAPGVRANETGALSTLAEGTDLIASAEPLMQTNREVYELATLGELLPQNELDPDALDTQSTSEKDTVSIRKIRSAEMTTEELLRVLGSDPRVLMIEPNYFYSLEPLSDSAVSAQSSIVADTLKDLSAYQWALDNNNETFAAESNLTGFDINAPSWNNPNTTNATGSVAVVDSGIDYTHPDLAQVMHGNMRNYVDYGGDYGFNAGEPMRADNPIDDLGHGTHCAGIIASEWNDFGTSGVASGVKLVAVRISDEYHRLSTSSILLGYEYLADAMRGGLDLKAINNSWAGVEFSQIFGLAVTKVGMLGAVSVVSSGNDSTDLDQVASTSSALQSNPYAVVITSSTLSGNLSNFSNYGNSTTNLAAPGSKILSTVPQAVSSYLPEVLDGTPYSSENITYESFAEKESYQFVTYSDENLTNRIGTQSEGTCYFDTDASSWRIEGSSVTNSDGNLALTAAIPVATSSSAYYLSLRYLLTGSQTTSTVHCKIKLEEENSWARLSETAPKNEWNTFSFNLQEIAEDLDCAIDYSDNQLKVQFVVESNGTLTGNELLYFDTVGIGTDKALVPYEYYSGTSMATPAATGAAMVLAASEPAGADPGSQALERAARLAGSVRQMEGYTTEQCSSRGALDLSYALSGDYTPVVNTASVLKEINETLITVGGYFFGSSPGVVTIDGTEVAVRSWGMQSLTFVCPPTLQSGLHTIAVTAQIDASIPSTGKTGRRTFLLELTTTPPSLGTPLFEREYKLPSQMEERASVISTKLQEHNGFVYVFPGLDVAYEEFSSLWRLQPVSGEWKQCSSIPLVLQNLSVSTYGEKLIVTGYNEQFGQCVYSYDPLADGWDQVAQGIFPHYTTIVHYQDQLILLGGYDFGDDTLVDSIYSFDAQSGAIEEIGTLSMPSYNHNATVYENTIVLVAKTINSPTFIADAITISLDEGAISATAEDISSALPRFSQNRSNYLSVVSFAGSLALVGSSAVDEQDTFDDADVYLLEGIEQELGGLSAQSQTLATQGAGLSYTAFDKCVSHAPLFFVNATGTQETLFVFGASVYEEDGYVLRAVGVKNPVKPVDPSNPDPNLPQTGDSLAKVYFASLLTLGVFALALARVGQRRSKRSHRF